MGEDHGLGEDVPMADEPEGMAEVQQRLRDAAHSANLSAETEGPDYTRLLFHVPRRKTTAPATAYVENAIAIAR